MLASAMTSSNTTGSATRKLRLLEVPPKLVTVTFFDPFEMVGTVAVIDVLVLFDVVAGVPLKLTVAPLKFVPVIVTDVPIEPTVGLSEAM